MQFLQCFLKNEKNAQMNIATNFGKYKGLLIAILLFIIIDLGILIFNYTASLEIERDAANINHAGELRMLTQQLTKSLLTLQNEKKSDQSTQSSLTQLRQSISGFDNSLLRLNKSLNNNSRHYFLVSNSDDIRLRLERIKREWLSIRDSAVLVTSNQANIMEDVDFATTKANTKNIFLMGFCDDLAKALESDAGERTQQIRDIQLIAIALALLNFFYIVFKFLRQLNKSDHQIKSVNLENERILSVVNDGLLLVKADGKIGTQMSTSVHTHLMRTVLPNEGFLAMLATMLPRNRIEEVDDYLALLFDYKVKPALLKQLDPMQEIAVTVASEAQGGSKTKYLSFSFEQIREDGFVKELLVTIVDVTQTVKLQQDLHHTQKNAKTDLDAVIAIFENNPSAVENFLAVNREKLLHLNQNMSDVRYESEGYKALVSTAMRVLHGIKGEAALLSLSSISRQIHTMESSLASLVGRNDLNGENFIPVALDLSKVLEQFERLGRLFKGTVKVVPSPVQVTDSTSHMQVLELCQQLSSLAQKVGDEQEKLVHFTSDVAVLKAVKLNPSHFKMLSSVLPQLVMNAVVHGIERSDERVLYAKPAHGLVHLAIKQRDDGSLTVELSDDGAGIQLAAVREINRARQPKGRRLEDAQVLAYMFEPHITTASKVTDFAGRGVGLGHVKNCVNQNNAVLNVKTSAGHYSVFSITFDAQS